MKCLHGAARAFKVSKFPLLENCTFSLNDALLQIPTPEIDCCDDFNQKVANNQTKLFFVFFPEARVPMTSPPTVTVTGPVYSIRTGCQMVQ